MEAVLEWESYFGQVMKYYDIFQPHEEILWPKIYTLGKSLQESAKLRGSTSRGRTIINHNLPAKTGKGSFSFLVLFSKDCDGLESTSQGLSRLPT